MAQAAREEPSLQVNRLMDMRVKGFCRTFVFTHRPYHCQARAPPSPKKHLAFAQAFSNQDTAIHSIDIGFATERHG